MKRSVVHFAMLALVPAAGWLYAAVAAAAGAWFLTMAHQLYAGVRRGEPVTDQLRAFENHPRNERYERRASFDFFVGVLSAKNPANTDDHQLVAIEFIRSANQRR